MSNLVFSRQLDIITPEQLDFGITIIGAGGIGSWTVLALAKMGCTNLIVYDFDKVETENTPSQFYKQNQIGKYKVEALLEQIKEQTGVKITPIADKWQNLQLGGTDYSKIVISAVDSMDERIAIWSEVCRQYDLYHFPECYIDARMGGELFNVSIINLSNAQERAYYNQKLFPSEKAAQEICTAKSVVYNTFFCGGMIASMVKKFAKKEAVRPDFAFDIANLMAY